MQVSRLAMVSIRRRHGVGLVLIILSIATPTQQYVYSCNTTAACGCSNHPASMTRIVGGEAAGTSTWGWAVSIFITPGGLCGGAVLSSRWIISAAHCFVDTNASDIFIFAGSNTQWMGQYRGCSSLIVHPNYNDETKENDIALLQLNSPLNMSDSNVKRICMPSVGAEVLVASEWPSAGVYVSDVFCDTFGYSRPMIDIASLASGCWMGYTDWRRRPANGSTTGDCSGHRLPGIVL